MTYKINGTELTLQPTNGKWLPKVLMGVDGNGHPIYSAMRDFQLTWQLISPADFNQILLFFNAVITTGSAVAELPKFNSSTYTFYAYTGCVLQEPELAEFFNEYLTNATMVITGIRA